MHEENFLSSWLRDDIECEAEDVEELNKKSKEEESKSGKRESEGEKERVAVVLQTCLLRFSYPHEWEGL